MKRIILLAAALAMLMGSARAAVAVRMETGAALLARDGSEIVAPGEYEDIVALGGDWFAASTGDARYALMSARGALLTEAVYDELRPDGERLIAHRDGGWGLLAPDGAELGAFDLDAILSDGAGARWALRSDGELQEILSLDADGRTRDTGLHALRVGEPGEGLLPLLTEGGQWGYCDASGGMAIPARYEWAGRFAAGCAPVVANGLRGAIDATGAWVVEPRFEFLEVSPEGFLLAAGADGAELLTPDGARIAAYPGEGTWAALAGDGFLVGDDAALRVYDASGALREELAPDASVSEGVGSQLVIAEGMWGEACVRLSGTEAAYQNLYPLGSAGDGAVYACMEVNAARYENDLLHEIQVSVDMDSARYGLVDGAGEPLLPCEYLSLEFLEDDRFLARTEAQWQMIDSGGRVWWRHAVTQTEAPSS